MNLGISGKVALVTACSSGLGKAVVETLAAEGTKLIIFSRSEEKLRAIAADIEQRYSVPVLVVPGDMSVEKDVERLTSEIEQRFGGLDILVLNSGRPPNPMREALKETENERWEKAYRTQLWGPLLVARKIVPLIVKRGWGRVIAITSASVKQPMGHHTLSTVFRTGVTGYMKHLANEIAASGVTVNMVCPASIGTEGLKSTYNEAERIKTVPVRRLGKPEELAAAVAFFASEQAGFITGASLQVDGGMVGALI